MPGGDGDRRPEGRTGTGSTEGGPGAARTARAGRAGREGIDPGGRPDPASSDVTALDGVAVEHTRVPADGVSLHAVVAGPGDGDLVVLLHGFPECWYTWRDLVPALAAAGHRVVAPDLRAYGGSDAPRGVEHYDLPVLVDDVASLVAHFDRSSTAVVGHDWGGIVAWEVAARRPGVLDRLAILNAPHLGRYRELLAGQQLARSWYAAAFQLPWLPELALRNDDFALVRRLFREGTGGALADETVDRFVAALADPDALTGALHYYRALGRRLAREEVTDRVGLGRPDRSVPTTVPVQVVWGERDPALVPANAEGLERWVADLSVARLRDVGHFPHVTAPGRVRDRLVGFLDG